MATAATAAHVHRRECGGSTGAGMGDTGAGGAAWGAAGRSGSAAAPVFSREARHASMSSTNAKTAWLPSRRRTGSPILPSHRCAVRTSTPR